MKSFAIGMLLFLASTLCLAQGNDADAAIRAEVPPPAQSVAPADATAALPAPAQTCSIKVKKIEEPKHVKAKAGHARIEADLELLDCTIPVTLNRPQKPTPVAVSIQPAIGIETKGSPSFRDFGPPPYGSQAQARVVHVTLDSELFDKVSVGKKTVSVSLSYKAVDASGNPVEGTYAFDVPLDVHPLGFWDRHQKFSNTLVITGEIIGGIVALPVYLVAAMLGIVPSC